MPAHGPNALRRLLIAAALAVAPLPAGAALAQQPAPGQACARPATPQLPSSTLPIELLDYLERTASSPFVEAFLLAHMTEGGNVDHWLGRCAKAFLDTPADSVAALRQRRIPVDQIIEVLRSAEEARLADTRLRESSTAVTIFEVLERLRANPDAATLAANSPYLSVVILTACHAGASLCDPLKDASAKVDAMRAAYDAKSASEVALGTAVAGYASARSDSVRLAIEVAELTARKHVVDSLAADLQNRVGPNGGTGPAADSLKTLLAEQTQVEATILARQGALNREAVSTSQAAAEKNRVEVAAAQTQAALDTARAQLQLALTILRNRLQDGEAIAAKPIQLVQGAEVRLSSLISSPAPLVATGQIRSAQSPNILLELTDFIIARAKQELVIGYLVQLYAIGKGDSRVQAAFPSTFRLMASLSEGKQQQRLSATAAGRVPLNVWRAAISDDYRHIPISLARNLCGANSPCARELAAAEPALFAAERLISGDPVFDVLHDLPAALRAQGSGWEPKLREGVSQGLSIAATLADALRVQGIAPTADPVRHPYILSGRALSQLSTRQRDAFVRVLLVDALPANVSTVTVNPPALLTAAQHATQAAEVLATTAADSGRSADRVIRSATTAFRSGLELARTLLPADQQPKLTAIDTLWTAVFDVLEPLARGDYSLVMPRTLSLVRTLSSDRVKTPAGVLTILGLATSLSGAQTGADVRTAFETAAAPVGLWQEKRYQQGARVSVTSFPGFGAGREWLHARSYEGSSGETIGLSMPVGLEIQLGGRNNSRQEQQDSRCLGFCSVGLYFSLIDLGALATYRISNADSVDVAPNTSFRQVFAPGVHLSFGIGRTPLALLFGGEVIPAVRDVTLSDGRTSEASAFRLGIAVAADVTLFRF